MLTRERACAVCPARLLTSALPPTSQLPHSFAKHLDAFPDVFVPAALEGGRAGVTLAPTLATCDARTSAVGAALEKLRAAGVITGWRNELYPIGACVPWTAGRQRARARRAPVALCR